MPTHLGTYACKESGVINYTLCTFKMTCELLVFKGSDPVGRSNSGIHIVYCTPYYDVYFGYVEVLACVMILFS